MISQELSFLLQFTICFFESRPQKQFDVFSNFSVMQSLDGLAGTFWTVLFAQLLWVIEADEAELADLVLEKDCWFNIAEGSKKLHNLIFAHVGWNIFDIDVIDQLPDISSIFGLENQSSQILIFRAFNSRLSSFFAVEADKAVATAGVILIQRNFQAFDFTILAELGVQILMSELLWNIPDEYIVRLKLFLVISQEISIKL